MLDCSLSHLSCPLKITHFQVECHIANPDNGSVALCEQQSFEIFDAARVRCPAAFRVVCLFLLHFSGLSQLHGLFLPFGRPLCFRIAIFAVCLSFIFRHSLLSFELGELENVWCTCCVCLRELAAGAVPWHFVIGVNNLSLPGLLGRRRLRLVVISSSVTSRAWVGSIICIVSLQGIFIFFQVLILVLQLACLEKRSLDAKPHFSVFNLHHFGTRDEGPRLVRL
mmetsp:Transcript_1803/g.3224  ORF Transcript_1803/g.3224 Transcript_1803/m.3224 type:complete len:224 (-) Transcript_1803:4236-4907(-)